MSKAFNRETGKYDYDSDEWCVKCLWERYDGSCAWNHDVDECKEKMKIIVDGEQ